MSELMAWCLVISSSLLCSIITAFAVHYLTKDRDITARQAILDKERALRKYQFIGVLNRMRCQLYRKGNTELYPFYQETACDIAYESSVVRMDFTDRTAFDGLVSTAISFRHAEIVQPDKPPQREKIIHAIDALLQFTSDAA